ncbi:pyridoxamine 5'-phosphate oxidase family protein [Gordonia soli]|uniref:Pyridoxamine 5'-phosphate oxidase N-terminal domain-containing protein n=1 Tax=Gordonia soli NBRC 108243 TaxID=1223545 RepID=M0QD43_9ACTN|nr:pyridoxamine 5'-phosphate oxidase family protein [Gordonia soli]GAC66533.1 hypothetical protein GS4_02_02440 [Gordonia soli NBRC 108243]
MSSIEISPRVAERVADEQVIWLTTVDTDGRPVPTPVWFLWSDDEVLVFSRPDTPKLRNIGENDRVALNLNSSSSGGDVAVLTARARIDPDGPNPAE